MICIDDTAGTMNGPIFAERRVSAARHHSPVAHDFAALGFMLGGQSTIEQRERWRLERGDVFIVPAGEPHRLLEAKNTAMWRLGFCVPCLPPEASVVLLEPFERVRDGASPVVRIPPGRQTFLESLFLELSEIAPATAGLVHVRQSLLTLIVREVVRAADWSTDAGSRGSPLVTETLRYIERHCLEPLTLRQIAAAMQRTPSHITSALTRATGRSAVAWIIACRLAEARRRLLHSDERVDDIAGCVGYADPTHFIRLFRRTHGLTPSAWRARQRKPQSSGQPTSGGPLDRQRSVQRRRRC